MQIKFKDMEEGLYEARLLQIKKQTSLYGEYLKFIFTITEGELINYRFSGAVTPTPIKQSKFYRWTTNILGREPDPCFSTEEMIGKYCRIFLVKQKKLYIVKDVFMK